MLARIRFQPVTNRETWFERVELRDQNGNVIDLSAADVRLEVKSQPEPGARSFYVRRDPTGVIEGQGTLASTVDGLIEWRFEPDLMRRLDPGLYDVGCVYELDGFTTQVFTGEIEIENGVLS